MSWVDFINEIIKKTGETKNPPELWYFLAIAICSIVLIIFIEKSRHRPINKLAVFLESVISLIVGFMILFIFTGIFSLIIGMMVGPLISFFVYSKYIKNFIDTDNDIRTDVDLSVIERGDTVPDRRDISGNVLNIDEIEKPDIYNLLDLMVLYNYISPNHRRRLYEESILLDTNEIDVNKLLRTPILSEDELKEIKNIQKVICLERRLLTMEEALKEIIKAKNRNVDRG